MFKDRYGLEVSTSSVEAFDAYADAADRMLAADGRVAERLGDAIEADPNFALAHAALARDHHVNGRGKMARTVIETAAQLAEQTTAREQQHVAIVKLLITGQVPAGLALTREHLQDYPRDALALAPSTGVFGTIGFSGRVGREAEQLELLEPLATHYGDDWWFATAYAFALLETGHWDRGRKLAEQALEQRPNNPHDAHTLAHALYEAGDDDAATTFLTDWLPDFDRDSLLHCHIWWHYAILLMARGSNDAAWKAFEQNCLPGHSDSPSINVFTDSASFLWRSELAGNERDSNAWETVRDYYEAQFGRPIVFVDAHVGMVYAALGETEQLTASIVQLQELGEAGKLPAETTGALLARAYQAFEAEQWSNTIELLEPLMDQVVRIGGSRAQRDMVTNTLLAAYVNNDRLEDATAFLASVHDRQPTHPVAGLS